MQLGVEQEQTRQRGTIQQEQQQVRPPEPMYFKMEYAQSQTAEGISLCATVD